MKERLKAALRVRVTPELREAFLQKANATPGADASTVLRQLIEEYTTEKKEKSK